MGQKFEPMLANNFEGDLESIDNDNWIAERKYDGTRLIVEVGHGTNFQAYTRRGKDRTEEVSYLAPALENVDEGTVLDGELVFLNEEGEDEFYPIHTSQTKIMEKNLLPKYVLFDILAYDDHKDKPMVRRPLHRRKRKLRTAIHSAVYNSPRLELIETVKRGFLRFYREEVEKGSEGIMLKRKDSNYVEGTRSSSWMKVKDFNETEVQVVGYTESDSDRLFGALVVSQDNGYVGKVGSGFNAEEREMLFDRMKEIEDRSQYFFEVDDGYQQVEPFTIDVKFQNWTQSGKLRSPVFLRIRDDKS